MEKVYMNYPADVRPSDVGLHDANGNIQTIQWMGWCLHTFGVDSLL